MEGKGSYNEHARLPALGGALAIPYLENAIADVLLGEAGAPLVIADYGSSQGRNSLLPMRSAIAAVRARAGAERPILVFHEDQPVNDFNSLFEVLDAAPDRYTLGDPNVFPCAVGRSFYEAVLPRDFVHVAWSSYAAMWLSRIPGLIPGHFFFERSVGETRAVFERQGASDWERFLTLRMQELRPGGCLVVSVPGADDDGRSVFAGVLDVANTVLGEMVDEGAISAEERSRMVLNVWPRRRADLVAPFGSGGRFGSLVLRCSATETVPDSAWADYQQDGNARALADRHSMFFRSIFTPTLATALDRVRAGDPDAAAAFADRLTEGLGERLAHAPASLDSLVQIIVVARSVS
jgi:hypothetical protein